MADKMKKFLELHNSVTGGNPGNAPQRTVTPTPVSSGSIGNRKQQKMTEFQAMHNQAKREFSITGRSDGSDDFVGFFLRDSQRYIQEASDSLGRMNWMDAMDTTKADVRSKVWNNLRNRGSQVRSFMENNRAQIDPVKYNQIMSYLDDFNNDLDSISKEYSNNQKYFSQWNSQEEYDGYLAYQKELEKKKNLDLDAYEREIKLLENAMGEYKNLSRWVQDDRGNARMDAIRQQYGSLKEMESLLSQKQQYLNQAKRIQKKDDFSAVADPESDKYDAAFDSKSGYVSTHQDGKLQRMLSQYSMGYDDLTYEYINNQNGIRDEIKHKASAYSKGETPFEEKGYDYMTEDEVGLYNYYYSMGGKDSAEAYLDTIQEDLNQRKAAGMYQQMEGKTGAEMVFGVEAGLDQFKGGIKGAVRAVKGDDSYVSPSAIQIASQMVREDLADDGAKLPSWLGGASLGQVGYDAITTSANMAPSIAVGMLNPTMGAAAMGVSAGGSAYQEALNEGYSVDQARGYGILSGASEIVMEKVLGGISAYGGNALGKFFTQNMKNADTALKRIAKELGGSMLSEFSEEYLQEVLTPVFKNLTLGTDEEVKLVSAEALYAGFLGAITGGIMEGPQAIANARNATPAPSNATELANNATAVGEKSAPGGVAEGSSVVGAERTMTTEDGTTGKEVLQVGQAVDGTVSNPERVASKTEMTTSDNTNQRSDNGNQEPDNINSGFVTQNRAVVTAQAGDGTAETVSSPESSDGKTEVSGRERTGKTVQISTGENVEIAKIRNVDKNGGMTFELTDGRTVDASDIQHGSEGEAVLYDAVADMGASAEVSDILVNNWKNNPGGVSAETYTAGMLEAFNYGRYHLPSSEMAENEIISQLTAVQSGSAYALGKAFGGELVQTLEANIRRGKAITKARAAASAATKQAAVIPLTEGSAVTATDTGKVHFDRKGRTLSAVQETGLKTMEQLSQLFSTEFHVYESYEKDGKRVFRDENGTEQDAPNGWYDPETGHIYIDLNAGSGGRGTMLFTVAHELTHFIRDWSPAKFDKLAEAVFELTYREKKISVMSLVREQQAKAARNGRDISFDEAYEEVVADSMESILTSGNVVELMAEVKQQDQSLWQKIQKWFQDLAADIRKLMDAYAGFKPDSAEGQAVAAMEEMLPIIEGFYMDALQDASENYRAAEGQKNTTHKDGKKYSYAGENARTADLNQLATAKAMQQEGVSDETIRQQTGWFMGRDGKWRFEIDDSNMRVDQHGDARGAVSYKWALEDLESARDELWGHADMETLNNVRAYNRAMLSGDTAEKNRLHNLLINGPHAHNFNLYAEAREHVKEMSLKFGGVLHSGGQLADYVQHDALYEAYPQLQAASFRFGWLPDGTRGQYNPDENSIIISNEIADSPERTIIHEIQHAIQKIEGFASGSSPEYWETRQHSGDSIGVNDQKIDVQMKHAQEILDSLPEDVAAEFRDWYDLNSRDENKGMVLAQELSSGQYGAQFYDYFMTTWTLEDLVKYNYSRGSNDLYRNTAGEIEARDTANRWQTGLDAEGRKNTPPDLGDDKTVFTEGYVPSDEYISGVVSETEIADNINTIAEMPSVVSIKGDEFKMGDGRLLTDVTAFFESIGGTVYNKRLGDIFLRKRGVRHDLGHGMSDEKAASFAAIPAVLENGHVAGFVVNKGGKGFDSATVVAPITIKNEPYMMGVIVHRSNNENRFYVHDVVAIKEEAAPLITGTHNVGETGGATSTISIIRKILSVKAKQVATGKKFSHRDSNGAELTDAQAEYFHHSKVRDTDGNLLVMHHGTKNGDFTVFDRTQATKKTGFAAFGRGNYFTVFEEGAKHYGNRVITAYLNIKNPLLTTAHRGAFVSDVAEALGINADKVSTQTVSTDLKKAGYDGVIVRGIGEDEGRIVIAVTYDSVQSKNTDNLNPTDNPDIRYSHRDPLAEKAAQALKKENERLQEDVKGLKDLVKLQGKLTDGKIMNPSSIEKAARVLKKNADAKGDTKELTKLLTDFYSYISGSPDLTWEGVKEAAQKAADWLWENRREEVDEYSAEILQDLRTRSISLSDSQKTEAAVTHDTFGNYRKSLFGSVKITKDGMSLDETWHELASLYPGVFDENMNANDMPAALADIVSRLKSSKNMTVSYDQDMMRQALIREVYDSYWNVSTLHTVADMKQKEINVLKSRHAQRMSDLRTKHREKVAELRQEQRDTVAAVRASERKKAENKTQKALDNYRKKQKLVAANRAERGKKADMRRRIRKTVMELDKLLNRGDKKKNVKSGMTTMVDSVLKLADALFMDEYTNRDMLRNGVGVELTDAEEKLFREAQQILQQAESGAAIEGMEFTSEVDAMNQLKKLDQKLSSKMAGLKDVFARERKRLYGTTVSDLLGKLADEYSRLSEAEDGAVRAAKDENVYAHLLQLQKDVGGTTVRDMTLNQMEAVADAFTMVLTTVRNANKMFAKNLKFDRETVAGMLVQEFQARKIPSKKLAVIAKNLTDAVGWNYEKLHYALERINSPTLTRLFGNLADSENITMRDVQEAKEFQEKMVEKYHYNDWDIDKKMDQTFLDNTGKEFHLTLGELMALYAYSRREGADKHIEVGGFTFGETALTDPEPATTYKLTPEQVAAISDLLTAEQKSFAEAMQKYLSETMGAKGNEVTMKLYGIEMFTEENYFPLHIAGEYKAKAQESQAKAEAGFQAMTNAGFTKARNTNATAPIVLEDFMGVWADHVNEMSRYHGAVPALEDIRRVMNYSVYSDAMQNSVSVTAAMTNAYGKQAVQYFDNLYREANSGAVTDRMDATSKKLLSLFRKNSVAYSASVVIQQPESIYRAKALIDGKYFGKHGFFTLTGGVLRILNRKKWNAAYAEMMKYAPGVTMAKEIGGFDTSTGSSIRSYLLDTDRGFRQSMKHGTLKQKAGAVMGVVDDNFIANLPNVADKLAWIEIWEACKRETVAKDPKMSTATEAFLQKVGQRFTEVIRATQVYDSMFSKSPMLKSRNLAVQYAVSFMNESNTVINMAEQAARDLGNKEFRKAGKTVGALATSIVATNLLKSIIYAMRDEDEDETFLEKYLSAVAGNLMSDVNVLNYIPIARDVWSIWEGYDVERSDMAIVADAIGAIQKLRKLNGEDVSRMTEEELEAWDKKVMDAQWRVAETLCPIAGVPLKNIRRDVLAAVNAVKIRKLDKGRESTELSIRHAIEEATGKADRSDRQKLYEALLADDQTYVQRLKAGYDDEAAYHTAIRKALREHDSRIWEAAIAWNQDNLAEYLRIGEMIAEEGHFEFSDIYAAIQSEAASMEQDDSDSGTRIKGRFTGEKFGVAMGQNNTSMADIIRKDLIDTKVANGKTREEATSSVESTARSQLKELFDAGSITGAAAEKLLVRYGGYNQEEAADKVADWKFETEYGFTYSDRSDAYKNGEISQEELRSILMDVGGKTREEADLQIQVYDWEAAGYDGATFASVRDYNEHCARYSVPKDVYLHIKKFSNNTKNDVDSNGKTISYSAMKKIMAEIGAQYTLTAAQKYAIARSLGWSEKNIEKYKTWH